MKHNNLLLSTRYTLYISQNWLNTNNSEFNEVLNFMNFCHGPQKFIKTKFHCILKDTRTIFPISWLLRQSDTKGKKLDYSSWTTCSFYSSSSIPPSSVILCRSRILLPAFVSDKQNQWWTRWTSACKIRCTAPALCRKIPVNVTVYFCTMYMGLPLLQKVQARKPIRKQ